MTRGIQVSAKTSVQAMCEAVGTVKRMGVKWVMRASWREAQRDVIDGARDGWVEDESKCEVVATVYSERLRIYTAVTLVMSEATRESAYGGDVVRDAYAKYVLCVLGQCVVERTDADRVQPGRCSLLRPGRGTRSRR